MDVHARTLLSKVRSDVEAFGTATHPMLAAAYAASAIAHFRQLDRILTAAGDWPPPTVGTVVA